MTGEVTERPIAVAILAAATGSGTSDTFRVGTSPVSVRLLGAAAVLAGAEVVQIQYQDAGANWHDYIHAQLGNMQLVATETAITIYDTGIYRATKTATAASTGLEMVGRDYC